MEMYVLMGTAVFMDIVVYVIDVLYVPVDVFLPHLLEVIVQTLVVVSLDMNVNQVISMAVIASCVMEEHLFKLLSNSIENKISARAIVQQERKLLVTKMYCLKA